jgi:hypothetical protein
MCTTDSRNYIHYYAEPLGHGRAIMRVDVVFHGELVESHTTGSPAPLETVRKHERKTNLTKKEGA